MNIENELKKPFPEMAIHWRIGARNKDKTKGLPLAYIDARDVMDRLDFVLGFDGWEDSYTETGSGRVICTLACVINGKVIVRSDGAGDTGTEGEKGAISDALKRAAVKFGIGRYLYGLGGQWVDLDQYGKFKPPSLPNWATPNGWNQVHIGERREVYKQTVECLSNGDESGLLEVWNGYDMDERAQLWSMFNSKQRKAMIALRDDAEVDPPFKSEEHLENFNKEELK
jgi:hypothetical protein